jgi:hypothetical protein
VNIRVILIRVLTVALFAQLIPFVFLAWLWFRHGQIQTTHRLFFHTFLSMALIAATWLGLILTPVWMHHTRFTIALFAVVSFIFQGAVTWRVALYILEFDDLRKSAVHALDKLIDLAVRVKRRLTSIKF